MDCIICSARMAPDRLAHTWRCAACGFLASTLPVTINQGVRLDESVREKALKPIRMANFRALLDGCADLLPAGARLLDVGCAHGWFMDMAKAHGLSCTGVEPDNAMADLAEAAGHTVLRGLFPAIVPEGTRFDVISFNDVLEHLPHVEHVGRDLCELLVPGGLVIINLPVSEGLVFRAARIGAQFGFSGPLARMWQQGLPSPHLSYFSRTTLPRLMARDGFTLERVWPLQAIETEGLYARIRYDRAVGPAKAAVLYAAARALQKVSGLFPSDIQCFLFRAPRA